MSQSDTQLVVLLVTFAISLLQLILSWLRDKELKTKLTIIDEQNTLLHDEIEASSISKTS